MLVLRIWIVLRHPCRRCHGRRGASVSLLPRVVVSFSWSLFCGPVVLCRFTEMTVRVSFINGSSARLHVPWSSGVRSPSGSSMWYRGTVLFSIS